MENSFIIIIVSFGSASIIESNLLELLSCPKLRKVIVENDPKSTQSTKKLTVYPSTEIIISKKNIGYGSAINLVTKKIKSEYFLVLNPDVMISQNEVVKFFRFVSEDNDSSNALWSPCLMDIKQSKDAKYYVSGAIMMIRTEFFLAIGAFDEKILLFFEETDLCRRFLNNGFNIRYGVPLEYSHISGKSSEKNEKIDYFKSWHYGWSKCYYLKKHLPKYSMCRTLKCFFNYKLKQFVAINGRKKLDNQAKSSGAFAFILGKAAREFYDINTL